MVPGQHQLGQAVTFRSNSRQILPSYDLKLPKFESMSSGLEDQNRRFCVRETAIDYCIVKMAPWLSSIMIVREVRDEHGPCNLLGKGPASFRSDRESSECSSDVPRSSRPLSLGKT